MNGRDQAPVIVAVDVGTTLVKAGVVVDGQLSGPIATRPLSIASPRPGWSEQDPADWWTAARAAIAEVVAATEIAGPVAAVAVTGQMQDLVAVDGHGDPVRPAILYGDGRASDQHDALRDELGSSWGAAIGVEPDATNVAAKWRWVQEHEPAAAAATRRVLLGAASFVVSRLCGAGVCDPSTAATTGLYDLRAATWWSPVVDTLGIPLPPLVPVGTAAGTIKANVAAELGLSGGIPVVHANGDAAATTIGLLGDETGTLYAALSTSCWVAGAARTPPTRAGAIVLPGLGADHWIVASQMPVGGAVIDWACQTLLGGPDPSDLDELVGDASAVAEGVMMLPHLDGTRIPVPTPQATGVLVGARRATSRPVVAAAVVEGFAHAVRQLVHLLDPATSSLVVCGGASRSRAVRQSIADVLGVPVHAVTDDAAALAGAAWAGALAVGATPRRPDIAGAVTSRPRPDRHARHAALASAFDSLVPTMTPIWDALERARRT